MSHLKGGGFLRSCIQYIELLIYSDPSGRIGTKVARLEYLETFLIYLIHNECWREDDELLLAGVTVTFDNVVAVT